MKRLLSGAVGFLAILILGGCGGGSSASPPADGLTVAPGDGRLFLLSNLPEENLARKYVLWGWFHLLTFVGATGSAAYLLGV